MSKFAVYDIVKLNKLMFLVIDQGNTLLKIALFEQDQMRQQWTFTEFSTPAYTKLLSEIQSAYGHKPLHGIISDVSGKVKNWYKPNPGIAFLFMDHSLLLPLKIKYKTPETLGKDRIALSVGAFNLFPGRDLLVVGAGTTITYDFINHQKEYLGGGISPGIIMRFRGLHTFTGKLPLINPAADAELIGDSTENSILSGVINGVREEVKGIILKYKEWYPEIQVILTGGDMNYFDKFLKSNIFAVSNLVLVGLKDILRYNVENIH